MSDLSSQRSTPIRVSDLADTESPTVRRIPESNLDSGAEIDSAKTIISKQPGTLPPPPEDQASPAEVAKVLEGAQLGNFRLEKLIGGGGMGAVFRAADTRLDRTVAVKVVPRVGEDADLQRRFKNEAQSAAKLDHPNIARVYDVGVENGWHYIVFEYIDGINLREIVSRHGVLSIDDSVYYTRQVAEALEHAHERGVVHRDVKPSNVIVTSTGQVKLVDMGLARSQQVDVAEDQTASGVTLGTFDYISPEQARDPRSADVRSDLYSLGCTLYFMLVGRPPFPGGSIVQKLMNHGSAKPPNPKVFRPEISPDLTAIIHKLLSKNPSHRYPTPINLIGDLIFLAKQLGLERAASQGTTELPKLSYWPQTLQKHMPWIVAVCFLLLTAAWIDMWSPPEDDFKIALVNEIDARIRDSTTEFATQTSDSADATKTATVSEPEDTEPKKGIDITTVVVSPLQDSEPDKFRVSSLQEALDLSIAIPSLSTIELHANHIQTDSLKIPRAGLTIRTANGFDGHVSFSQDQFATMEGPVKFDVASHGVRLEGVHLNWKVPNDAVDGGTLFSVSLARNKTVELVKCSITIENLREISDVFAFRVKDEVDTPRSSSSQSLIWLEWDNCIFRGQMTLIGMKTASALQVKWRNGLLATSGRFLETGGAANDTIPMKQIKVRLENVTSFTEDGFARINIGPSGAYPVSLQSTNKNCTFAVSTGARMFELAGLETDYELIDTGNKCLTVKGLENSHHLDDNLMGTIYRVNNIEGEFKEYFWGDVFNESWFTGFEEDSLDTQVIWTDDFFPPARALHRHEANDYLQGGINPHGFDDSTIIDIPQAPLGKSL